VRLTAGRLYGTSKRQLTEANRNIREMYSTAMHEADEKLLDWSAKQGRILTDRGNALKYYSEEVGFPFSSDVSSQFLFVQIPFLSLISNESCLYCNIFLSQ
jgi:hypothetical protein